MIIFIREIPETASKKEVDDFVSDGLNRMRLLPFPRKRKVEKCDILRIKDLDTNRVEYHGLAYIDDERTAKVLIKHLNDTKLNGKRVQVRNYHKRSPLGERRRPERQMTNLAIMDRRQGDRRRSNILVETLHGSRPAMLPDINSLTF